jgi:predicted ester cyclase
MVKCNEPVTTRSSRLKTEMQFLEGDYKEGQIIMSINDDRSIEQNKSTVREFFESSNQNNIDRMLACWAPDATNHGRFADDDPRARQIQQGVEGLKHVFNSLQTAFPDRQWKIYDMIAVGDRVVCRLKVSGTHQGIPQIPVEGGPWLQAIQPTGKPYSIGHIHIFRMVDGLIAEHWAARDDLGLLVQLGGLTPPAPKAG